jgi:hypothetical protein
MRLSGQQIEEVMAAFVDAFDHASLERMLRLRLDRRLDQLGAGGSLDSVVLGVIDAAEKEGWTPDLVREAGRWNPGNRRLAALVRSLLPQLEAGATSPAPAGAALAIPRIDPDDPPYAVLRELLSEAFDANGLRRFCQFHEPFRPLVSRFAPGHGLEDMVDLVLVHADKFLLWGELLAGVAEENPYQFERFVGRL